MIEPRTVFAENCNNSLHSLDKSPDKVVSGWLTLFIYLSQLQCSVCLLMFPFLSCGMLIICMMLCWFQECRGQPWKHPSEKRAMGKNPQTRSRLWGKCFGNICIFPFVPTKTLWLKWKREQTAWEIRASDGERQLQAYRETLTFPCLSALFYFSDFLCLSPPLLCYLNSHRKPEFFL